MPFIIPNAGDTTGGATYLALDQAEPDALDFEIMGNSAWSGVFSGCAVTPNQDGAVVQATAVAVSAGSIVLKGVPYAVTGNTAFSVGTSPADFRFDLVVARVSGTTATLQVVQGVNSATNPTYPKSKSITAAGTIDLTTDVVLAAVYRVGGTAIGARQIMDKRVPVASSIPDQGSVVPSNINHLAADYGPGSLYFQTGVPVGTMSNSGVWVKTGAAGAPWIELAQNLGPHLPVGAMVAWPSKAVMPAATFIEANGQSLSTTAYPALFAVYSYDHNGGVGVGGITFKVPDMHQRYIRGTTVGAEIGLTGGAASYALPDVPYHSHGLNGHTHAYAHTHSGKTGTEANDELGSGGQHNHYASAGGQFQFVVQALGTPGPSYPHSINVNPATNGGGGSGGGLITNSYTNSEGFLLHYHYYTTTSQSASTTSGSSDVTTATGSTITVPTLPPYVNSRWIIRASIG